MATLAANIEHYSFSVEGIEEDLRLFHFSGTEYVFQNYRFTLDIASENPKLDLNAFLHRAALITCFGPDGESLRHIHGIVEHIEQLEENRRFTYYRLFLVPRHNLLNKRVKHRIYQSLSVPEIIQQVFKEAGLQKQTNETLQKNYPLRDYCVQYGESDLDFVERLMAEEGIYYFYDFSENDHTMIIADNESAHQTIVGDPDINYHAPTTLITDEDMAFNFRYEESVQIGQISLSDYNFQKPALKLMANKKAPLESQLEEYRYPGNFDTPDLGNAMAEIRLQAHRACKVMVTGQTNSRRFVPGQRFSITTHPKKLFNQEYFILNVAHSASQPHILEEMAGARQGGYTASFTCIPSSVTYRPLLKKPRPSVHGNQTAIVVGPEGEEIYTDKFGRIKVQFHWDREGKYSEKSSCWMRVSHNWAGAGWGAFSLPRIGQEVLVGFINGDPARPIVTGRVYHGTNLPPYKLPKNNTKSTLKSNSSKGGAGFNEIRIEDLKSEEQLFLHAQKNEDVRVKNNAATWVGNDSHSIQIHDQIESVENDKHQTVKGDHNQKIKKSLFIHTDADVQHKTSGDFAHDAGTAIHLKAGNKVVLDGGQELTLKVGGNFLKLDSSGVTINGSLIKINEGGSAGSGAGVKTKNPAAPLEADNAKPGTVEKVPKITTYELGKLEQHDGKFEATLIQKNNMSPLDPAVTPVYIAPEGSETPAKPVEKAEELKDIVLKLDDEFEQNTQSSPLNGLNYVLTTDLGEKYTGTVENGAIRISDVRMTSSFELEIDGMPVFLNNKG